MKRDPRTVLDQMKSGLKISLGLIALLALGILCFRLFPRYRMEALLWHWRHGDSVRAGSFQIPVPRGWVVRQTAQGDVRLINTTGGTEHIATVMAFELSHPNLTLEQLERLEQTGMASLGARIYEVRHVEIDGIKGFCIDSSAPGFPSPIRSIQCRLGTGFNVNYAGTVTEVPVFYTVLSGISKPQGTNQSDSWR